MGSTETESDEDDYMPDLTRKIAQSTIQDSNYLVESKKGWWVSGSPQSTLCSVMASRGCHPGSGCHRTNCLSTVSTPPVANRKDSTTSLDLLSAAAAEVARIRMMEETLGFYSTNYRGGVDGPFISPRKPSAVTVPSKNLNRSSGFYPNHTHLSFQQLQATQFQQLKEQQMMKQPQQGSRFYGQMKSGYSHMVQNNGSSNALSMDGRSTVQQSPKHQQTGSGMRVFLGDPGTKKERTGTGVFLPRRVGAPTETRKKSGCSTVLLPDRVVQALNLNLESMDSQALQQPQNRANGNFIPDYAAAVKYTNNVLMAQQRKNQRPAAVTNQELRLPQEWTY
ncbi:unnamed protein product [Fraxinus pennsylvanica]|uniref:Uncharacterized protein n=1 Tax=Fraxinus pennsylvanica TaxID=56036 RepID=A0AAD1Z5J5_9LAMI|nr:unnamed protein product [Fraxinus pennsylvanica]